MADSQKAQISTYVPGQGHLWWGYDSVQDVQNAVEQAQRLQKDPISIGELYFVAEAGKAPPVAPEKIKCPGCRERLL